MMHNITSSQTGTSKKNWISWKRSIFLSLISESETHILYRFITQSELFQAFISRNFDDYNLQIMKTQNSVYQKIRILHKINKKDILNRNVRLLTISHSHLFI